MTKWFASRQASIIISTSQETLHAGGTFAGKAESIASFSSSKLVFFTIMAVNEWSQRHA